MTESSSHEHTGGSVYYLLFGSRCVAAVQGCHRSEYANAPLAMPRTLRVSSAAPSAAYRDPAL